MELIAGSPPKFADLLTTAEGKKRASVTPRKLRTVWFNTGTLCNLACESCYIESSPSNDRLSYLTIDEVRRYLDEIAAEQFPVREIGLTGGEPFMNPDILPIIEASLAAGHEVLVLTNAMRPMMKLKTGLKKLADLYGNKLTLRVSVDHYTREVHQAERGARSWTPMIKGLQWLSENHFNLHVAGRSMSDEPEAALRAGYAALFEAHDIRVNTADPSELLLFPEMDTTRDVPEITTECWSTLNVDPSAMMCASSRMVVKHRGRAEPEVVACTLLPYAADFALGQTLRSSWTTVPLNHRYCAEFCVLGGGSCTA